MKKKNAKLKGNLFLLNDEQSFAEAQVQLLMAIDGCGSISGAAKLVGISYKTAWDRIDAMNNMSVKPLVIRSAGGSHGGGTQLTELGKQIVAGFQALQEEHETFIERLGTRLHSIDDIASFMKSGITKTSARNQFRGVITGITPGAVNAEVELSISDTQKIIAIITNDSLTSMKLDIDTQAIALIKASWVLLSKNIDIATSARNKLIGLVSQISHGAVNSDVTVDLGDGKSVCAIITNASVINLDLHEGDKVCALFKASSVILITE